MEEQDFVTPGPGSEKAREGATFSHRADRCDQDGEIYIRVQEIWSASVISGWNLVLGERARV